MSDITENSRVDLRTMFLVLGLCVAGAVGWVSVQMRISDLAATGVVQRAAFEAQLQSLRDELVSQRDEMKRLRDRLDRLIDKPIFK